jgi:L-iditol 2-dehydrogenase
MAANRAAVMHETRRVELETRPVPVPGPRGVLIRITACGVCGSDVHYYERGRIGPFVVTAPIILGHECAGVVVDLGPGASRHRIGDRVALEPGIPCGRCRRCRAGAYNLCQDIAFFATPPYDGAFTDHVVLHEDFAFSLPDEVSDEAGALIEPLSVGLWASRRAGIGPGDRVLITGAGPIGLLAAEAARARGATDIAVTDVNPHRLALAAQRGARTIDVREEGLPDGERDGWDVAIECSGADGALHDAVRALRPGGTAVLVGMNQGETAAIPTPLVQIREITIMGSFRYADTYPEAIALLAAGRVSVEHIITSRHPLEDTVPALEAGRHDAASVKPMVLTAL